MIYQPPLPPPRRLKFFIEAIQEGFTVCSRDEITGKFQFRLLMHDNRADMILLASICEVEWSKRAERWRVAMRKCFDLRYKWAGVPSWDFVGCEPRSFGLMDEGRRKCLENVESWRIYGEQE